MNSESRGRSYTHSRAGHRYRSSCSSPRSAVTCVALDVTPKQRYVPSVCSPNRVKHVADQRDSTNETIQGDVAQHANEKVFWRAKLICLVHDVQRRCGSHDVSDTRYKSNECIQPKSNFGARNHQSRVEEVGQCLKSRESLRARTLIR